MSTGRRSKIHLWGKRKGSEHLLSKEVHILREFKNAHFLTRTIKASCWIVSLRKLLRGRGLEGLWLAIQSFFFFYKKSSCLVEVGSF